VRNRATLCDFEDFKGGERTENAQHRLRQNRTSGSKLLHCDVALRGNFVGNPKIGNQSEHTRYLKSAQEQVELLTIRIRGGGGRGSRRHDRLLTIQMGLLTRARVTTPDARQVDQRLLETIYHEGMPNRS
jgi:hypothetical protein